MKNKSLSTGHDSGYLFTVFIGTKAMLLKVIPVINVLVEQGAFVRLIDTGQHALSNSAIAKNLDIPEIDCYLIERTTPVATMLGGMLWFARLLLLVFRPKESLKRKYFNGSTGFSLVHGDTISTLICALLAKRAGQKVVHVEAGLRSYKFFDPFPEEIVRVMVMKLSDYLFAPSPEAYENLIKMGLREKAFLTPGNTNMDTLKLAQGMASELEIDRPFSVATLHRLETIYDKNKLSVAVQYLVDANHVSPLVFVVHPATEKRLRKYQLDKVLADNGVKCMPLQPHYKFTTLLAKAEFVITDGGSVQEEVSYLGTPCLILRKHTERNDGIGGNVVLSKYSNQIVSDFLRDYAKYRKPALSSSESPSEFIVDKLLELSYSSTAP